MKTIKNITDKKAFWVGAYVIVILLLSISIIHAEDRFRGYVEQSYFPVNDEHGIYAETKINVELDVYKNWFVFVEPTLSWAKDFKKPDRSEKRVTSYDVGFGYFSNIDAGIGYKFSKNWELKLLYRADRTPNGNVGDFTGISAKWSFGK